MTQPGRRRTSVRTLLVVAWLLGGCSVASSTQPNDSTPVVTSSPPVPTDPSPIAPSLSVEASPSNASDTSQDPVPPLTPGPTPEPPPDAALSVDGGDPVVGELGSWGWKGVASDSPWLPGYKIHVGVGERLTLKVSQLVRIANWQVARVPPSSVPSGNGAVGMADGTGNSISFDAPPSGQWSVAVSVWFSDPLGSAVYYWAVTVE